MLPIDLSTMQAKGQSAEVRNRTVEPRSDLGTLITVPGDIAT